MCCFLLNTARFQRYFFIFIKKSLDLDQLQKRPRRLVNASLLLRNHSKVSWKDRISVGINNEQEFSEEELKILIKNAAPKRVFLELAELERPNESVFHLVEALHTLLQSFIDRPSYHIQYKWPWYRKTLKNEIPKVFFSKKVINLGSQKDSRSN